MLNVEEILALATKNVESATTANVSRWSKVLNAFAESKGLTYNEDEQSAFVRTNYNDLCAFAPEYKKFRCYGVAFGTKWKSVAKKVGVAFNGKETLGGFNINKVEYIYTNKGYEFNDLCNGALAQLTTLFANDVEMGTQLMESALNQFETKLGI